jgi:GNAT superfamily N-acetyltransferase
MSAFRNSPFGTITRHFTRARKAATDVTVLDTPMSAPEWTETLQDGSRVIIRVLHKEDAALERDFIGRLSPESRRMRFLGGVSESNDVMIHELTDLDYGHEMAFVALVREAGKTREIGVSRYNLAPDGKSCECAVTVSDEWQGKGLGTLLMRHLIEIARQRGIRSMFSIDSANNSRMRELARDLGFARERDPDDSTQVIHRLTL